MEGYKRINRSSLLNSSRQLLWPLLRFILLTGLSFMILYPFIAKISAMFMSLDDLMNPTVWIVPQKPTLDNIKRVLAFGDYWIATGNTAMISMICAVLQTFICTMVGYGFAKFKFRGRGLFFALVVLTIIIPPQTIYISLYMKFRYFDVFGILEALGIGSISMVETVLPVTLLSLTGLGLKNGLYIFVMRQIFKGVPKELNEAACVDGCGPIRSYFSIMMRIATPMMVSIFMLSFAWQWTDTFYSELFYRRMLVLPSILPRITTIASEHITADSMMSNVMLNTGVIMIIIPLIILYLFCQRLLIQGIERSGIVG
ncbi:MAG TPA: carbohydrate ABC transporter permease [Bacillota bacterium]|nr:carbohydrate ABC transporter permease [Bacillota bacterium]